MSKQTRRRFITNVVVLGAAIGAGAAVAQTLPELSESDATAAALGYKADTTKVDKAKYPNHKDEQICDNCNLVQGKEGEALRPCAIFPGKSVAAKGWCAAYVPKK